MIPRAYTAIAVVLAILALMGACYGKGRSDGRAVQAADYAQERAVAAAERDAERQAMQQALDAARAELDQRQREGADAVALVRTEYLPGRTIVRREVVDRPVFRECRIGGLRDTINAALAGRPVPAPVAGAGDGGMPR